MKPLPILERMLNGVWLTLFDLGLKPGHAVRTVSECVDAANDKSPTPAASRRARHSSKRV